MSEKRFAIEYDSNCYKCIFDNEQKELYSSRESICDLLNSLSEENEQLKDVRENCRNQQVRQANTIHKLLQENEQLRQENNMLKITIDRNESYIQRLTHQSDWHC